MEENKQKTLLELDIEKQNLEKEEEETNRILQEYKKKEKELEDNEKLR